MRRGLVVISGVATVFALGGCQLKSGNENLVNGKEKFSQECSGCHTLARANATGVIGPNLDDAFRRSRIDGLGESTFEGIVHQWILHPNINAQVDPNTGKELPLMPGGIFTGQDALDVAAYVAAVAGKPGKDTGKLAAAGAQKAEGTAKEENGTLDIPGRRPARPSSSRTPRPTRAASNSRRRTRRRSTTTSPSTATASTRRAKWWRTAARPRSRSTSSPARTRSTAPSTATAPQAWRANSR